MSSNGIERAGWGDAKGLFYLPKKSIKLKKGWQWTGSWMIEGKQVRGSQSLQDETVDHDGTYDSQGWQYSDRFGNMFSGHQKTLDFVRRRKWVRVAERIPEESETGKDDTPEKMLPKKPIETKNTSSPIT